ncbi:ATP-dependent nuclease [Metapseudomonas otitidis]|uniref:ATP-dependent nuclease n=1 Tax=Metapseudomonas otitidis TaxID=319939 RepID=UPI0039FD0719
MSDDETIAQLVEALREFRPGKPLKNYIAYAVFPKFKSIEPSTRVDFNFPLTALVGANGIGKSSLLHALWGMPYGYSTSKFWFSTALDPIEGTQRNPQRYFYGHWNESFKGIVETRKARVGSKRDYWEPARRSGPDGMAPLPAKEYMGKASDRWNPVRRNVVYINLKATFGSFDRYFYFDGGESGEKRRQVMLNEATRLKSIKDRHKQSYKLGGRERLFENRELTKEELEQVSKILGRTYESARLIRHSLYPGNRGQDLSVVFRRGSEYSEAFAGSGEIAAVSAVVEILAAEEYSLILLDEPETSLHPGAQRALLCFLLEQIKTKKHQVVISTHSSEFLEGLPHEAIKVFEDNGNAQCRILPKSSPHAALKRLGKTPANRHRVLVEDPLAALLVAQAAKGLDPGDADLLDIRVAPGGAESILKYLVPAAIVSGDSVFVMLDGDQRKVEKLSDPTTIAPAEYDILAERIQSELGVSPTYCIPGGNGEAGHRQAKIEAQLAYLAWARKRISYLPRPLPEQVLLEASAPGNWGGKIASKVVKGAFTALLTDGADIKLSGAELHALAKVRVAKLPADNSDLLQILDQLKKWLHE